MGTGNKVVYLRSGATVRFEQEAALACQRLQTFLGRMFDGADDALFDLSGHVRAGEAYFDAMRQLRLRRREVEAAFAREMRARVEAVSAARAESPPADGSDLELDLAVDSMIAKARAYGRTMKQFRERMTRLLPYPVARDAFPFDPQPICAAFRSAVQGLDLDIKARLVIFKMFERHVVERLPELYGEFGGPAVDKTSAAAEDAELDAVLTKVLGDPAGEGGALERAQDDTLGFLGMLFDAILSDPSLPAPIKALIGRLQHPLLKRILKGEDPFRNRAHPARLLIDEMASAAVDWREPANLNRDPLYRTVEMLVERVLQVGDDEPAVFDAVLAEFRAFLVEEQRRAERIAMRTRRTVEGKARVDAARARVNAELVRRLGGDGVSETARTLISQGWAKVLFIACLQDGAEGASFSRALATVDRLLWSLAPKSDRRSRSDLLAELPTLLRDLREGLSSVMFDPFETNRLLEALEAEHRRALMSTGGEADAAGFGRSVDREVDRAADTLARVQALPEGSWLEFRFPEGSPQRAKLGARLTESGRLIFVYRSGFRLMDMTPEALADALTAGSASVLEADNLFDKALRSVVASLREPRPE